MKTLALVAAFLATAPAAAPPGWTLKQARAALAAGDFFVTDTAQVDRPGYDLVFTRAAAKALKPLGKPSAGKWRRFAFAGRARDLLTGLEVPVRLTLTSRREVLAFRGPPADTSQPSFPIRAAFYYAWYPEAWTRESVFPYSKIQPALGFYGADEEAIVRAHVGALRYGRMDAGIYSWWGPSGYPPTDGRFWRYLAVARTTPFRWAIYYEREGYENPTVEKIRSDLEYVRDLYASKPAYLKVDGRFVVFVYANGADSCEATAERWRQANTVGAYVVLSGFGGYLSCPFQPQAWHQYSADRAEYALPPSSFMISPAFEEASEPQPRLARDPARWRQNVADMVASGAPWQLVISFNEWPEGTSVENAPDWASPSGYGAYLDALHDEVPPRR